MAVPSRRGVAAEMLGGCTEMVTTETGTTGDGSIMGGGEAVGAWAGPEPGPAPAWSHPMMFEPSQA